MISAGDIVFVQRIQGGDKIRTRLFDLGLNINARVRVVKNDPQGPLILAVKEDGRFALGKGMAHHILVRVEK
jgi:Fe2+ transport system protein FeoA